MTIDRKRVAAVWKLEELGYAWNGEWKAGDKVANDNKTGLPPELKELLKEAAEVLYLVSIGIQHGTSKAYEVSQKCRKMLEDHQ